MCAFPVFARRRMAALPLLCATLLAGPVLAQDVVKLGYSGPLSGGAAQYGKNVLDGMQMAVSEINAAGPEIGGRKVKFEIVALDDKYNPSETAINAQRLVQQHKTPAIVVPHSGGIFAAQVANERHNYVLLAYSTLPEITARGNRLTVRVPPEFLAHIEPFSRYTMDRFGTRLAMVGGDHDAAKAWAAAVKNGWERLGGTVVAENPMSYNRATDFYSGVSKALAGKPDVLFVAGASEPTALVVKQARELGFKGGFIVMEQAKLDEMVRVVGDYEILEGAIGVLPASIDPLPTTQAFVGRLAKLYPNRVPTAEIMHSYAVVHATARAMQLAGTATDPKAIRAQYDAAYKSLDASVNLGRVRGVDADGGTQAFGRRAAVEGGKVVVLETGQAR